MTYHKKPPTKPINLSAMIILIARFGSYLNKTNDRVPRLTALLVRIQKLCDFIKAKNICDIIK